MNGTGYLGMVAPILLIHPNQIPILEQKLLNASKTVYQNILTHSPILTDSDRPGRCSIYPKQLGIKFYFCPAPQNAMDEMPLTGPAWMTTCARLLHCTEWVVKLKAIIRVSDKLDFRFYSLLILRYFDFVCAFYISNSSVNLSKRL